MTAINETLHADAIGLRLYRIDKRDELLGYELITFQRGRAAVEIILRRAQISGRVEIEGEITDHFADVYTDETTWEQSVALDKGSFDYLRNKLRPRRS